MNLTVSPRLFHRDAKITMLRNMPFFAHSDRHQLEAVAQTADLVDVPAGMALVTEGQHTNEFCVITEGAAEVTKGGAAINTLAAGDFFGEIALVTGRPRTATVTATEASTLLVFTGRSFWHVAEAMPSLQAGVLKVLAERLGPQAG